LIRGNFGLGARAAAVEVTAEYPVDEIVAEDAEAGRSPYASLRIDVEVRDVLLARRVRPDLRRPVPARGPATGGRCGLR
jgi:hypothetical protein